MKQGRVGVQVHITASSAVETHYKVAPFEAPESKKRSVVSRCFPCLSAQVSSHEPVKHKHRGARQRAKGKKGTKMWRFLGGVFQPVLGTANYLLSPTKPQHKPVVLPTGLLPSTACHLAGLPLNAVNELLHPEVI